MQLDMVLVKAYLLTRRYPEAGKLIARLQREVAMTSNSPALQGQVEFWSAVYLLLTDRPGKALARLPQARSKFRRAIARGQECEEIHMVRPWLERCQHEHSRRAQPSLQPPALFAAVQRDLYEREAQQHETIRVVVPEAVGRARKFREAYFSLGIS